MATAAEELKKKTQSFKMGGASGFVPGIGSGDKVPAKYEPGEFVVSRDMLALDPKLGAHLTSLREMALAKQGMTPEQADAKAMMGGKLHAARGFGDFELTPIDPAKEIPQTKMAKAMQNATRINSRLPPPAWAPATPQPSPVIQAPNLTTSPGATPTISGPPAPPKPISAPNLGFSEGAHRDNRINFNAAPEPVPVNATTSMGAAPGRATTAPMAPTQAAKQINIPSGYTPPKVNPATGAYANQGPAAPLPIPEPSGRAALAKSVAKSVGLGAVGYGAARIMNDIGKDAAPGTGTQHSAETQALIDQIPTGGSGKGPTPSAQPYSWWADTETGRNVSNTLNALAPMGSAISGSLRAGSAAARLAGAGEAVAGGMAVGANGFKSQDAVPPAVPVTAPTVTPAAAPQADVQRGGAQAAPTPTPAPEADATGKVQVTRQPNGIMEFSGKDITGDPQYTGSTGFKAGGFGVSSLGGPIAPSAASQAALTNPDGSRWSAQDSAVMAANMRDGIDAYRGTSRQVGNGLISFGGEQESGRTTRARMADATEREKIKAATATSKASGDLDRQRFGLEAQKSASEQLAQGFGLRSLQRMEDVQKVLLDPNATPEARKLAKSRLAALNNKTAADRVQMVNMPDTVDANGTKIGGGQVPIRMNEDGTIEQVPIGAQQQAKPIPAAATADLKANPKMAADFDAKYGAGAAAKILGQK